MFGYRLRHEDFISICAVVAYSVLLTKYFYPFHIASNFK